MRNFQIDPSPPGLEPGADPIRDLCWRAREILAGYMEEACDIEPQTEDQPTDTSTDDGEGLAIHDTTTIKINSRQFIYLSNLPFVFDAEGEPMPFTEPNYVALRALQIPAGETGTAFAKSEHDDQIVFRVPAAGLHSAAIFEGWTLEDSSQITAEYTDKLAHIGRLLLRVQTGLRHTMETDEKLSEAMYLSQVPARSTIHMFEAMLRGYED